MSLLIATGLTACNSDTQKKVVQKQPQVDMERTRQKAAQAQVFCSAHHYNTDFCILIDMSLHSGVERFLVWDFRKNTIVESFLVSHGCCNNPWGSDYSKQNPTFSNTPDSHCSSLGKYKIGVRGYSNWGVNIKYLLHGLEPSNSKAQKREIVFHSWERVSNEAVYPAGTPEGWGCPAISNKNFLFLDPMLRNSPKPVLMWIYN